MSAADLTVVVVYPELLGTYGDRGNVMVLAQRLAWRGIAAQVVEVPVGGRVPTGGDVYVLGGGEDAASLRALADLREGGGLAVAVDRGAPVLAVCAGLQILGSTVVDRDGGQHAGLDLLDVRTVHGGPRRVGEVVAEPAAELGLTTLVGFENHAGTTELGPAARPLATVLVGQGNGGTDPRYEGALQGSVIGTYLHGPLLARNPALADLILHRALGHGLEPLPDVVESQAREELVARASAHSRRRAAAPPDQRLADV